MHSAVREHAEKYTVEWCEVSPQEPTRWVWWGGADSSRRPLSQWPPSQVGTSRAELLRLPTAPHRPCQGRRLQPPCQANPTLRLSPRFRHQRKPINAKHYTTQVQLCPPRCIRCAAPALPCVWLRLAPVAQALCGARREPACSARGGGPHASAPVGLGTRGRGSIVNPWSTPPRPCWE